MISVSKSTLVGIGVNLVLSALLVYILYTRSGAFFYGGPVPSTTTAPFRVAFVEFEPIESALLVQRGIIDQTRRADGSPLIDLCVLDANGDKLRLHALMEQAVEDSFDAIVPFGSMVAQLAQEVTTKRGILKPVVFCGIGDPAKIGIIDQYGRSPEHITGFGISGFGFVEPMINQLPVMAPHVRKILIPYNPTSLGGTLEEYYQKFAKELTSRGYSVTSLKIYNTGEVCQKIQPFLNEVDMYGSCPIRRCWRQWMVLQSCVCGIKRLHIAP